MRITLGMPTLDAKIPAEVVNALMNLHVPDGVELFKGFPKRQPVHNARNAILNMAKEKESDYVLFIDDDQLFGEDLLFRLFKAAKDSNADMITGWIRKKTKPHHLCVYKTEHKDKHYEYKPFKKPFTGEVDGVAGAGCLLVSKQAYLSVMENHKPPFELKNVQFIRTPNGWEEFHYKHLNRQNVELNDQGAVDVFHRELSEDFLFVERAKRLGYKLYADKEITLDHMGPNGIVSV